MLLTIDLVRLQLKKPKQTTKKTPVTKFESTAQI